MTKHKLLKLSGLQMQERTEIILYLWNKGCSYQFIADILSTKISRQRVQQIVSDGGEEVLKQSNKIINYHK